MKVCKRVYEGMYEGVLVEVCQGGVRGQCISQRAIAGTGSTVRTRGWASTHLPQWIAGGRAEWILPQSPRNPETERDGWQGGGGYERGV